MIPALAGTRLRMELDRIPLWRGDHVAVRQLAEDFARYVYLPRLRGPEVLAASVQDGVSLLLWQDESFAYADGFDEATGKYRGLRCGQRVDFVDHAGEGLLVKPEVALRQQKEATAAAGATKPAGDTDEGTAKPPGAGERAGGPDTGGTAEKGPKRFYGRVSLDAARVGRDAGRIADEVIAHLTGLVGSAVTVTLEIEASMPDGAPENVVRTVTENGRTLKFDAQGFESE